MPIEVVSVRVREHPYEERTPFGAVSWTERIEREWMKQFEKGRRPTKGRSETNWNFQSVHERQRWRYEQTKKGKECDQMFTTETLGVVNFLRKNDSSSEFWGGDYHFVREFFIFKPAIKKSSQRLIRNWRETDRIIVNRRLMLETYQQQDSYSARNQALLWLLSLLQIIEGFWLNGIRIL